MLRIFLCLFVILPALAFAQPCLPAKEAPATAPHIWEQPPQNVAWIGTPMQYGLSIRGGWVRWYCAEVNGPGFVRVTRVSTLADLPNVGGRVRTILAAADPLKSLQTAPSRINILPLSDPGLADIVAEIPK